MGEVRIIDNCEDVRNNSEEIFTKNEWIIKSLIATYCSNIYYDKYLIEDLEQELRIELWQRSNTYNADLSKFSTYVYSILRNKLINILKERNKKCRDIAMDFLENGAYLSYEFTDAIDDKISYEDDVEYIRSLKESILGEKEKKIIDLLYGFNEDSKSFSITEIAQMLGITPQTVARIRDKALMKLRKRLGVG